MFATRGLHLAIHGYRLLACLILVSTSFGQQLGDVTGCICLEPYYQICGSDGITYANQCHLNCIALLTPGLQKAKNGPCQQDDTNTNFAVPDDPVLDSFSLDSLEPQQVLGSSAACDVACVGVPDEPVCGNNHKTYRNKCDLQCAATMNSDLRPGYPGACRTNCYCSARLYTPLCGSDGFTYPSRCWIRCAVKTNSNLQLKHFSACTKEDCEQRCADDGGSTPLCGSDGKVYKNRCYFRCAQDSDKSLTRELRCTSARRSNPALPPCACPNDNRPVCGTDGRTYDNECLINCAQRQDGTLHVAYAGVCKEPCECSRDYNPVCGANGKTYTNDCTFRCARDEDNELQMNHIGRCSSFFLCLCFSRANSVCGSDGVTYVNTCKLNCAAQTNPDKNGLTMVHTGECPGSCVCGTQQTDRICGNDGTTYRNRCELECAAGNNPGLRVMQTGVCPCDCDNESSPVCGRDGITYNNQCEFECAKRLNTRLRLLRNGPCPCICAGDQNPVCGSDNVSYNNLCELECKINDGSVAGLQMLYEGPCHQDVCDCSNRARHLVCGNDRQTYVNQCELSCAALLMPGLRRASVGPCIEDTVDSRCNVDCSEAFVPVCGSDGKTYNSRCHLACKAEHSPADAGLTVYYHAECEQDCLKRCGDLSEPVCGTNEITYQNECYLDCATYRYRNLVVDYNGECVPDYQPCICNFDFSPVCGTDGNTYANQCSLECEAKLQPDIEMECDHKCPCQRQSTIPVPDRRKPQRQCIEACNDLYKPVCGKTISLSPLLRIGACTEYSNECYMAIAACRAENADQRVERCDCPSFS